MILGSCFFPFIKTNYDKNEFYFCSVASICKLNKRTIWALNDAGLKWLCFCTIILCVCACVLKAGNTYVYRHQCNNAVASEADDIGASCLQYSFLSSPRINLSQPESMFRRKIHPTCYFSRVWETYLILTGTITSNYYDNTVQRRPLHEALILSSLNTWLIVSHTSKH